MTDDALDRLAPLADPVRRSLYAFVAAQSDPVDRDAAATGVGIGRPLAAFHLDRLAAAGLLDVEYHRRSGRSGPGAGRPAKFYRRARGRETAVSLPPRRYEEVAEILAEGVERSADARGEALAAATRRGHELAAEAAGGRDRAGLLGALTERGYEPAVGADGVVRLRNCPFDRLATDHRELTCSLNLAMLSAVAQDFDAADLEARAKPIDDGYCCVALVPTTAASG
jgi:predicted ArsR family transcriptional regulator